MPALVIERLPVRLTPLVGRQLVLPSFRLADDNAPAVVQVCRRLDGLPPCLS